MICSYNLIVTSLLSMCCTLLSFAAWLPALVMMTAFPNDLIPTLQNLCSIASIIRSHISAIPGGHEFYLTRPYRHPEEPATLHKSPKRAHTPKTIRSLRSPANATAITHRRVGIHRTMYHVPTGDLIVDSFGSILALLIVNHDEGPLVKSHSR